VLNGWQRIKRVDGNQTPAFGHQVTFTPNSKVSLNSSSFIGNDFPDSLSRMRYFHNFYGVFQLHRRFGITAGFDIGAQQSAHGSNDYDIWYSPVLIARYALSEKWTMAARGEYYSDEHRVIIATGTPNGFQTIGYSLNLDYAIRTNVLWRIEGRGFQSKDNIFILDDRPSEQNYFAATSLAVSF